MNLIKTVKFSRGTVAGGFEYKKLHPESFQARSNVAESDYWLRRVCLSVRMEQFGSHWTDFHEI
jgi:hypothetical protein